MTACVSMNVSGGECTCLCVCVCLCEGVFMWGCVCVCEGVGVCKSCVSLHKLLLTFKILC